MEEITKVFYHIDEEQTPYLIRLQVPPDKATLGDFKNALQNHNYKFFFKSVDDDFGVVKEEIANDNAHLPCSDGRVESWLVTAEGEGSVNSDGTNGRQGAGAAGRNGDGDADSESACSAKHREDQVAPLRSHSDYKQHAHRINAGRLHPRQQLGGPGGHPPTYESTSSMMSSDLDTTSFCDSEDDSSLTTTTYSINQHAMRGRRKRRTKRPPMSRTSSFSSITESTMSLNVQKVVLDMDAVQFLGISIVGHPPVNGGSGGIYVGSIMRGGAVEREGTIQPGDMLLEVNDIAFENLENDEAVRILREQVQKPGKITLVVAKCWDSRDYLKVPREEPVRPIDPRAWVLHTNAMRDQSATPAASVDGGNMGGSTLTVTAASVSTSSCSLPESERYTAEEVMPTLNVRTDLLTIAKAMHQPESGLEVRDRTWLKIVIPKAFIGSDLVDWLFNRVEGFTERKEAKKFAFDMLKRGYIKHTVNKVTFSEQCYYVFGDIVAQSVPNHAMSNLSLMDNVESLSGVAHDAVGLAPPMGHLQPAVPHLCPPAHMQVPSAPWSQPPPSYPGLYGTDTESVSQYSSLQTKTHTPMGALPPVNSTTVISDNSDSSSGSSGSRRSVSMQQQQQQQQQQCSSSAQTGLPVPGIQQQQQQQQQQQMHPVAGGVTQRDLVNLSQDMKASKQSFRMAMNNPC